MKKILLILIAFVVIFDSAIGQRVMAVQTPQFHKDMLWYSCNFTKYNPQSAKDSMLFNSTSNGFTVEEGSNNKIYEKELVNLVNMSNRAFEGISQKLVKPMEKLKSYKFSFSASRDTAYQFNQKDPIVYKKVPLKLYVFGSDGNCGFGELLSAPFEITNHKWDKYSMLLRGTKPWTHIVIYAAHEKNDSLGLDPSNSYLMISQHNVLQQTTSRSGRKREFDPGIFKTKSYSKLSFGGILMMYEINPKPINIFNAKTGEIVVSDTLRKDLDRNQTLDSILHKFRGIDFLFLVMKEKKYGKKKLNVISYLKTKYPEILEASKVMKYSALVAKRKNKSLLKEIYNTKEEPGDLLVLERVREFVK